MISVPKGGLQVFDCAFHCLHQRRVAVKPPEDQVFRSELLDSNNQHRRNPSESERRKDHRKHFCQAGDVSSLPCSQGRRVPLHVGHCWQPKKLPLLTRFCRRFMGLKHSGQQGAVTSLLKELDGVLVSPNLSLARLTMCFCTNRSNNKSPLIKVFGRAQNNLLEPGGHHFHQDRPTRNARKKVTCATIVNVSECSE